MGCSSSIYAPFDWSQLITQYNTTKKYNAIWHRLITQSKTNFLSCLQGIIDIFPPFLCTKFKCGAVIWGAGWLSLPLSDSPFIRLNREGWRRRGIYCSSSLSSLLHLMFVILELQEILWSFKQAISIEVFLGSKSPQLILVLRSIVQCDFMQTRGSKGG